MTVHLQATIPATLEQLYELLTDGVLFGPATGMPGQDGGARGFQHPRRPHLEPSEPDVLYSDAPGTLHVSRPRRFGARERGLARAHIRDARAVTWCDVPGPL